MFTYPTANLQQFNLEQVLRLPLAIPLTAFTSGFHARLDVHSVRQHRSLKGVDFCVTRPYFYTALIAKCAILNESLPCT